MAQLAPGRGGGMSPPGSTAMVAARPEGAGQEPLLSPAPLKCCGTTAECSTATAHYPDMRGAFVCLGEQPSCSPPPASYQLQI